MITSILTAVSKDLVGAVAEIRNDVFLKMQVLRFFLFMASTLSCPFLSLLVMKEIFLKHGFLSCGQRTLSALHDIQECVYECESYAFID